MVAKLNEYTMPQLRPEPERDRFGRYVLPDPTDSGETRSFTRATTMAKAISDEYNLTQWKRRTIVEGLKLAPELLDQIDFMEDPRELRATIEKVADEAHSATGADVARDRGTQLHYFTEAYDVGALTIAQIPDEYRNEIRAYAETMAAAGITIPPDMVERIYVNMAAGRIAGTADRGYVILPNGRRVVADVKTGKDLGYAWPEICMQLAIYANAEAIVSYDATGAPVIEAAPDVDKAVGLVMHLPVDQGKCTLHLIDLSAGWAAVELASEVREYRSRRNLARLYGKNDHLPDGVIEPTPLPVRYGDDNQAPEPAQKWHPVQEEGGRTSFTTDPTRLNSVDAAKAGALADPPVESSPEADAMELTPADEARRELDRTLAEIANLKEGWAKGKRRTKAMIEADNAYEEFEVGSDKSTQAFGIVTRKLRRGYKLDDVPVTAPPPKGPDSVMVNGPADAGDTVVIPNDPPPADSPASNTDATSDEFALVKETEASVTAPEYVAELQANDARNARQAQARTEIDSITDPGWLATIFETYADVWDDALTAYGQAKAAALSEPPTTVSPTPDELRGQAWEAITSARSQADLAAIYEHFSSVWVDELTAHGQSVAANFTN